LHRYATHGHPVASADGVTQAARLLGRARRPVMFLGNGVNLASAWAEARELAELLDIPVATSLLGKGAFPESHPLAVGMTGIWGTRTANETTREADVLLAVGTGFGEAECSSWNPEYTFNIPATKLIQMIAIRRRSAIIRWRSALSGTRATLRALIREPRDAGGGARQRPTCARRPATTPGNDRSRTERSGNPFIPLTVRRWQSPPEGRGVRDRCRLEQERRWQQLPTDSPCRSSRLAGWRRWAFLGRSLGAKLSAPDRKVISSGRRRRFVSVGRSDTAVGCVPVLWVLFSNLLLDDSNRRHDLLPEHLRHGIPAS
jgi:acetolactate synthase-1/2/3 large subunit